MWEAVSFSVARAGHERGVLMRRSLFLVIVLLVLGGSACSGSLEGNGDVVTETRTVSDFDIVRADNGVQVSLAVDPAATGDVVLTVTTDSNLQEFLITEVTGSTLRVAPDRSGGVTPSGAFDASGTVDIVTDVSVDNGAQVEIAGSLSDVTLSADNGAQLDGEKLETTTATIDADNGAKISVCLSGTATGEVKNGANLKVLCGGNTSGVETSDGGAVSVAP